MFMLRSTHEAEIASLKTELSDLRFKLDTEKLRARTSGRLASEALAARDAAIARAEAAEARLAHPMKDRPRDAKGHFLKVGTRTAATEFPAYEGQV